MPTFTVLRRVDAFVDYTAIVEADDEEEAAVLARRHEEDYNWREDGTVTFDAREYVTLTTSGDELDHTRVGDF
jgi:hypothetical protein